MIFWLLGDLIAVDTIKTGWLRMLSIALPYPAIGI